MKYIFKIRLILLLLLSISCGQKRVPEKNDYRDINSQADSQDMRMFADPDDYAERKNEDGLYRNEAFEKLTGDSLELITLLSNSIFDLIEDDPDSSLKVYRILAPYNSNWQLEILALASIRLSNLQLLNAIYRDLNRNGDYEFSDDFVSRFKYRGLYPFENSDTSIINFVFDTLGWSGGGHEDSVYLLIRAIEFGRQDLVSFYLRKGWRTSINTIAYIDDSSGDGTYYDGYTPLDWALQRGDTTLASLLMKNGAQIRKESLSICALGNGVDYAFNKLSSSGYDKKSILDSSLWFPTMLGQLDKVERLLNLGANLESMNSNYNTPIFYTLGSEGFPVQDATKQKLEILGLMLERGVDINHQNKQGLTPLMFTSFIWISDGYHIKLGFAKLLLNNGARTDIKDSQGKTFWDHIILNKNKVFMDYFSKKNSTPPAYKAMYDSLSRTMQLDMGGTIVYDLD